MALKTARSSLYLIDPEGATDGGTILPITCVTAVQGISAGREQLENTCLEDDARSYEAGVGTPGTATFTINFEPSDDSHFRIYELWRAGTTLRFALGLGDGPPAPAALVAPGINTDGDDFDLPDTRSFILFEGYLSDVPIDLAVNAYLTANVSVQVSDFPTLVRKAA